MMEGIPAPEGEVKPRRPARAPSNGFLLPLAPPRPWIEPGPYEAVSTAVAQKRMRMRLYVEILFTVFEGPFLDGVVLATGVPGFYNVPAGGASPSSRLGRLVQLLDPRAGKVHSGAFVDKAWRVLVGTVTQGIGGKTSNGAGDQDDRLIVLARPNQYSKVIDVLERLA